MCKYKKNNGSHVRLQARSAAQGCGGRPRRSSDAGAGTGAQRFEWQRQRAGRSAALSALWFVGLHREWLSSKRLSRGMGLSMSGPGGGGVVA
jgi:hypothetical protein